MLAIRRDLRELQPGPLRTALVLGLFLTALNLVILSWQMRAPARALTHGHDPGLEREREREPEREYTYVGDDFPTRLPLFLPPTQLVLESGAGRFSLYADDDWAELFPASDGFTDLPLPSSSPPSSSSSPSSFRFSNSNSSLEPGRDAGAPRTFLISMIHQLHCLDVFRVSFLTHRPNSDTHVEHCLRYMLQLVLCFADSTLERDEPGRTKDGRWEHAAGGVGAVHECRDWRVLREYLDEHPAGPVRV